MKYSWVLLVLLLGCCLAMGCDDGEDDGEEQTQATATDTAPAVTSGAFIIQATNSLAVARVDSPIMVNIADISAKYADFNPLAVTVAEAGAEIPSQIADVDGDGVSDTLIVVANFAPSETKTLTVTYDPTGTIAHTYPVRTQAYLGIQEGGHWDGDVFVGGTYVAVENAEIPADQTQQSHYFQFDGVGWESEKIAYRLNLDWRNTVEFFGKLIPDMVLQRVGLEGANNEVDYHTRRDWGLDIVLIDQSMGHGSACTYTGMGKRIQVTDKTTIQNVDNGPLYAHIQVVYTGWDSPNGKINLTSDLSIAAGSRVSEHRVTVDAALENIAVPLTKNTAGELLPAPAKTAGWTYQATYGAQSQINDNLGMAVFYRVEDLIELAEVGPDYLTVLRPNAGKVKWYFAAAWVDEPGDAITTKEAFTAYIDSVIAELDAPIAAVVQ